MNVYRMDPMRTPSFAKSLSTLLTVLAVAGSPAVLAAEKQPGPVKTDPSAPAAEAAATSPAPPPAAATTAASVEAKNEAATVGGPDAEPATRAGQLEPAADPPSVTEVGIQRLPGSAYPEPLTRGLPYGSLSLTFHGLQWPYMPAVGTPSRFVIGLSGWGWIDTSYQKFGPWTKFSVSSLKQSKIKYWKQQSRMLLRVTPTYALGNGYFVQGQAELVGTEDQTIGRGEVGGADTDDLWLRIGKWNSWDLMVGRFEGWEVFHLGMGLDQNTFERQGAVGAGESDYGITFYGLTDNQFRPQGAAGNMAFHYYPLRFLRFELLGTAGSLGQTPVLATRPVAILDLGWLKLKAGTEYQRLVAQGADDKTEITSKGVGGAIQFVFEPYVEFGLNAAQGTVWNIDSNGRISPKGSYTRTSYGAFANLSNGSSKHPLLFGFGAMLSEKEDQNNALGDTVVDKYWLMQSFAAVQYVVMQQLYVKLVGGYSRGHWQVAGNRPTVTFDDEMYSIRLRFAFYY